MAKIIIGADFVPTKSNEKYFENGSMENIIDMDLIRLISEADYRIFNLEVPLCDETSPIKKCGTNLIAPTKTIKGYLQLQVNFFTLANNHILDQGEQGLWKTVEMLEKSNISYSGIGHDLNEASQPFSIKIEDKKVGIYCCAEHEFSIAEEDSSGANPFDPLESLNHIVELKRDSDYVICLYHGGKEDYRYPSPMLQKTCRKIIDAGADIVICQHTHCIGCEEVYKNGVIVYGQGNFLMDGPNYETRLSSLLIQIDLDNNNVKYIPLQKNKNGVKLADNKESKKILSDFNRRSEEIKEKGFINDKYTDFAKKMIISYVGSTDLVGNSLLFRIVSKLTGQRLRKFFVNFIIKKHKYLIMNRLECEAHRELYIKGLKVMGDE